MKTEKKNRDIKGNIYLETQTRWNGQHFERVRDKDGKLFSYRNGKTACIPDELPEWYVRVSINNHIGYLNANRVPDMRLTKDEDEVVLLISYSGNIEPNESLVGPYCFTGYEVAIKGVCIRAFYEALAKYTDFNATEALNEFETKSRNLNSVTLV